MRLGTDAVSEAAARFYGHRVVAAAFVVAVFGWGVGFYGPPVYLEAVRAARGWPVGLVSGAVTTHFLAGVVVVANLPRLHRRFGLPRVTFAGAVALALGVLGWSLAARPWQLYAASLLSGAGWVTLGAAGINAMIAPWYDRRRPAALSIAYNGASVGGVVFSPLWVALIGALGFPGAAALVGGLMLAAIGGLAASVLRATPASVGQAPDGDAPDGDPVPAPVLVASPVLNRVTPSPDPTADLWRDAAFRSLALSMALALVAQIGVIAHFVSLLAPVLGPQGAGLAAGLATACAILGCTLVGWWLPPSADRRAVAALSLAVQMAGAGALALADGHVPLMLLGVALFGLGIGNATSLPPLIAQAEFPKRDVPRAVALAVAVSQAAYAFAPATFGLLRELAPPFAVYAAAAGLQLVAACVYLAGRGGGGIASRAKRPRV